MEGVRWGIWANGSSWAHLVRQLIQEIPEKLDTHLHTTSGSYYYTRFLPEHERVHVLPHLGEKEPIPCACPLWQLLEQQFCSFLITMFLAVQNRLFWTAQSRWPCHSLTHCTDWLRVLLLLALQSDPRDLWPLRHLIRVMGRHNLTEKDLPTYIPTQLPTQLPSYLPTYVPPLENSLKELS